MTEYKILSFSRIGEYDCTWMLQEDSGLFKNVKTGGYGWSLDNLLTEDNNYSVISGKSKIHSIIRLSDGDIFTIGDNIKQEGESVPIDGFVVGGSPNNPKQIEGQLWVSTNIELNYGMVLSYAEKTTNIKPKKPPIGLMPIKLHREQRLDAINQAIIRYLEHDMAIPTEWLNERETIISWLK